MLHYRVIRMGLSTNTREHPEGWDLEGIPGVDPNGMVVMVFSRWLAPNEYLDSNGEVRTRDNDN